VNFQALSPEQLIFKLDLIFLMPKHGKFICLCQYIVVIVPFNIRHDHHSGLFDVGVDFSSSLFRSETYLI